MIVIEERKICRMLEGLFQFDKECEWNDAIEEAMHRFVNLPTIEAEPVRHGRWIIKGDPENGWYKITCSECGEDETAVVPCIGFMPNVKVIWDFCPNCGAKMDGGDKNAIS